MGKNNLENILKTEGIKNEQPIKSRYYKIAEGLELFTYGSLWSGVIALYLNKYLLTDIFVSAGSLTYASYIMIKYGYGRKRRGT
jgi:hypothetical protein